MLPNLFIIGAPKCGTTSMAHYLGKHPNIFMCKEKEPHYFNEDLNHRYYKTEDTYLQLFSEASESATYLCDASVWYLYSEVAVKNILKFNPEARFIIMLREHSDLFFSLHRELRYWGEETQNSPQKAWELVSFRKKGNNVPSTTLEPKLLYYDKTCALGNLVERALDIIPREQLRIIFLEDLKEDSNRVYEELLLWLGLKVIALPVYEVVNEKKERISPTFSSLLRKIYLLKKQLGIHKGLGISNYLNRLNVTKKVVQNKKEEDKLRPILKDYFEKDRKLLEKLTGRDLSHWSTSKS